VSSLFLVDLSIVENGKAVHLLKPNTKKRKRKSDLEEEKKEEKSKKFKLDNYDELSNQYEMMQNQMFQAQEAMQERDSIIQMLEAQSQNMGILNEESEAFQIASQ